MDEVLINIISIVILIITIIFLILALPINIKEDSKLKKLGKFIKFTKENSKYRYIAYVFFPFIAIYALFFIAWFNNSGDAFFSAVYSLTNTVKSFVFETDLAPIEASFKAYFPYKLTWLITYPYALIFVYATIINAFTNMIKNKIIVKRKLKNSCDIVIGIKDLKTYAENNNDVIVWVEKDITKDDENILKSYKIPYIKKEFSVDSLNKIAFNLNSNNEYHFISFNDENYNLHLISVFKKFITQTNKDVPFYESKSFYIHVEISSDNISTLQDKILENHNELASFIQLFNRHKLIAYKFIEEHPITKYITKFIDFDKAAIINESESGFSKHINVVYLGFGRLSRELFKASSINDQIPSYNIKTNEIDNHLINYYAFDNCIKTDKNSMFYEKRFEYYNKGLEEGLYFKKPEKVCNFNYKNVDINSEEFYDEMIKIITSKKEEYSSIVISLKDDIYNIDCSLKLIKLFKELDIDDYHLFVRIKEGNQETMDLLKDEHITYFGLEQSVLNREMIVQEDLLNISKLTNEKYAGKRLVDTNWYKSEPIKQKSNLFSSLNMRLKLNLLGFDYCKTDEKVDNSMLLKELEDKLKFNVNSYDDYLYFKNDKEIKCAQILAYQEHSRWNAFYISQGYLPFKKQDIEVLDIATYTFKKDDNEKRLHACLTTYKGLDDYHNLLANLACENNNKSYDENILKVETYKYDFNLQESFNKIFADNYVLVRIR